MGICLVVMETMCDLVHYFFVKWDVFFVKLLCDEII